MKAILEFNLDEPDDKKAHLRCVHADHMYFVLFEMTRNARKRIGMIDRFDDFEEGVEAVFKILYEELEGWNINLEELE